LLHTYESHKQRSVLIGLLPAAVLNQGLLMLLLLLLGCSLLLQQARCFVRTPAGEFIYQESSTREMV